MYAQEVQIKLKPGCWYGTIDLARSIQHISTFSARDSLAIARKLLNGERWSPDPGQLNIDPRTTDLAQFFDITVLEPLDQYAERLSKMKAETELLKRACDGDAAAAIEFCQKLKSGEIQWGTAFA
jgi:hypothetical protein